MLFRSIFGNVVVRPSLHNEESGKVEVILAYVGLIKSNGATELFFSVANRKLRSIDESTFGILKERTVFVKFVKLVPAIPKVVVPNKFIFGFRVKLNPSDIKFVVGIVRFKLLRNKY